MRSPRRGCGWVLAVLLAAGFAGCASDFPEDSRERDGFMGVLLPRPFGSVSMERSPIACTVGWIGVGAGAIAGGALGAAAASFGEASAGGITVAAAAGFVAGGFVGGLVLTPVGHLLQWIWDLIAGGEEREEFRGHLGDPPLP